MSPVAAGADPVRTDPIHRAALPSSLPAVPVSVPAVPVVPPPLIDAERPGATIPAIEWPTVLVAVAIYGGWIGLIAGFAALPLWLAVPLAAWLVAWHGSLQHETVHGHPFRRTVLNRLLAWPPLALVTPYPLYCATHIAHHRTGRLAHPTADPESFYQHPADWRRRPGWQRALFRMHMTLPGRLLLGPALMTARLWGQAVRDIGADRPGARRLWAGHAGAAAAVLAVAWALGGIDPLTYGLCIAYPGLALTMLRSFAEHRPAADTARATAIVESNPLVGLLFLHNNLHCVHHDDPRLPWYRIPAVYRRDKRDILAANGGYHFDGYGTLLWRFGRTPRDTPQWTRTD